MKTLCCLFLLFSLSETLLAQGADAPVRNLSDEEILLVQAYRKNPEPFRCILYSQDAGAPHRDILVGPRDVIDVAIEGGSIGFYGKSQAYDPVSFRITRGDLIEVVFRRQKSLTETRVKVAYRSDGLHFDVPKAWDGMNSPERGLLVIGEDERWRNGTPITQDGKITSSRTQSKADHITFRIRYVFSRQ